MFCWVCCAAVARDAGAVECTTPNTVNRTSAEIQRYRARSMPGIRSEDGSSGRSFNVGEIVVLEDNGAGELIYRTRFGDPTLDLGGDSPQVLCLAPG
jgi:hypothetical protein